MTIFDWFHCCLLCNFLFMKLIDQFNIWAYHSNSNVSKVVVRKTGDSRNWYLFVASKYLFRWMATWHSIASSTGFVIQTACLWSDLVLYLWGIRLVFQFQATIVSKTDKTSSIIKGFFIAEATLTSYHHCATTSCWQKAHFICLASSPTYLT